MAALNEAGCHLSAAQAHERDDLEEEGAVASLTKAASCLCCFDKMWNSSSHPDHFINNQNPSKKKAVLVTLSLAVWQDACGEDMEESCEEEHQNNPVVEEQNFLWEVKAA